MNIKEKFWIGTFISLWVLVSTVSTFHSVEFFGLSNNVFLSWCLAIGFEIGAMASLGGILISKGSKTLIWGLFILLTAFQIQGNMYYAWIHAEDISGWINLFGLGDEDPEFQKRIFAFVSGGILPLVSLGFIKSLMDYLSPKDDAVSDVVSDVVSDAVKVEDATLNNDSFTFHTDGTKIAGKYKDSHGDITNISNDDLIFDEPDLGATAGINFSTTENPTQNIKEALQALKNIQDSFTKEVEFDSEQMGDMFREQTLDNIGLTKEELKDNVIFPESNFLSNQRAKDTLENLEDTTALNIVNETSKLSEVIDKAEEKVNSIGEK
tara:strand:- start:7138 stop:8106 length:969 start_codon:yes stop_codon:yes gene_type:complete